MRKETNNKIEQGVKANDLTVKMTAVEAGHRNLTERGLETRLGAFSGGVLEQVTREGAAALRDVGAFKHAKKGDLVMPLFDAAGALESWRLWPQATKQNPRPKRIAARAAAGWLTTGLVWADDKGRGVLCGDGKAITTLLIVEGEPDGLTAAEAVWSLDDIGVLAVCGCGAWSDALGERINQWSQANEMRQVILMTDRDRAGERYAAQVRASISSEVYVLRTAGAAGRGDLNDLWLQGSRKAFSELLGEAFIMPAPETAESQRWVWSDDARQWTEDPQWTQARAQEIKWAEAAKAAASGETTQDTIAVMRERAQAYVEAGLEATCAQLQHIDGDRFAAMKAMARIASYVDGGALSRGVAEARLTEAYVRGCKNKRKERKALIKDVLKGHPNRRAVSLDDIMEKLAAQDEQKRRGRNVVPSATTLSHRALVSSDISQTACPSLDDDAAQTPQSMQPDGCDALTLQPLEDCTGFELRSRFLPANLLTSRIGDLWRSIILKSAQGTGKTQLLRMLVLKAKAQGERVLIITHRRSLARSLSHILRSRCYLEEKGQLRLAPSQALTISLDSLHRLVMRDGRDRLEVDLLIMDESEQVARHMFGKTVGDKLASVADDLFSLLRSSKKVVCADADAGKMTQRLLVDCASRAQGLLYINNTWNEWGFNVNGSRRVLVLNNHKSAGRMMLWDAVKRAVKALGVDESIAVACTSKAHAQDIAEILKNAGLGQGVLLVTSATKDTPAAQAFLTDPNGGLPRVLIYSPTIGTGVSIDREIKRVFVCGAAVQGITGPDTVQLMTRVRKQTIPPLVWLDGTSFPDMPQTFDDAFSQVERRLDAIAGHTEDTLGISSHVRTLWRQRIIEHGLNGRTDDALLLGLLVECLAETGRTGFDMVQCTLDSLKERGAEVISVDGNDDAVESLREEAKEAREVSKAEMIAAVLEAPPLAPDADLEALRQTGTPEALIAITRYDIHCRVGVINAETVRAAIENNTLNAGRKFAFTVAQASDNQVAQYVARGTLATFKSCTARAYHSKDSALTALIIGALKAFGLDDVLRPDSSLLADDWAIDLNDKTRLASLALYLDETRDLFNALRVDIPGQNVKLWQVREWLFNRLASLGMIIARPKRLHGGERELGKVRQYMLTKAVVVEAWRWAQRPFSELVEAAESDAAHWTAGHRAAAIGR